MKNESESARRPIGLLIGPMAAGLAFTLSGMSELAFDARVTLALAALMAVWWASEAVPIAVTALSPMVVLPIFGVLDIRSASAPYADNVVMLLLGGFIMATAIERWNLHARVALNVVAGVGSRPAALVAGFMGTAALLSMWISNTATTLMMAPIALSVANAVEPDARGPFHKALLLGLAYAASVGGLATPVGTPTNLIIMGQLREAGLADISFAEWMGVGLPVVLILVPALWLALAFWIHPTPAANRGAGAAGAMAAKTARSALGPITAPEVRTALVFAFIAFLWVVRRDLAAAIPALTGLTDTGIAVFGAVLMFLVPSGAKEGGHDGRGMLLDWRTAEKLPWGVVLLFGGGFSLAEAIRTTGLAAAGGEALSGLQGLDPLLVTLVVATLVIFATELMSNVATISAVAPVLIALSLATGMDATLIAMPAAMAASCAFMLPIATGPNAVVYATGRIATADMAKTGARLNIIAALLITLVVAVMRPIVF